MRRPLNGMSESRNFQSEVAYVHSEEATKYFDKLPSNIGRSSMVHSLIKELGLLRFTEIFEPIFDSRKTLEQYHSSDYLDIIFNDGNRNIDELDSYGLVDDCSIFDDLQQYSLFLGGAVNSTLNALEEGFRYVINWDGGRHHAQASLASGFCFINDVVLLILNLEADYDKILYIDLDLHHGDGVENAFIFSDKVFTFSIHKHKPGFFPGTGSYEDQGKGRGLGYCLNLPIPHKLSGEGFEEIFRYAFSRLITSFDPDIIVCVCGADVLSTDPHQAFNVGSKSYSNIVSEILETKIPTVFLGGGGYHHPSTAKLWSTLTHKIIDSSHPILPLPSYVPEHEFWPLYADDDNLSVPESPDKDNVEAINIAIAKSYIDNRI